VRRLQQTTGRRAGTKSDRQAFCTTPPLMAPCSAVFARYAHVSVSDFTFDWLICVSVL
jgi:hypothetical protein